MKRTPTASTSTPRLALRRQAVRLLSSAELVAAAGGDVCDRDSDRPCCPTKRCPNTDD